MLVEFNCIHGGRISLLSCNIIAIVETEYWGIEDSYAETNAKLGWIQKNAQS